MTEVLDRAQELQRLRAVRRYDILDTPPDGSFDRITRLAAQLLDAPIALVTLVDEDRIWFKSRAGLEDVSEISRDPGLCASAILSDDVYLVEDARRDPRTLANPLVAGEFGLQFYAAAPLVTADGHKLGTLCVIDHEPRQLAEERQAVLTQLAGVVMDEMELRLAALVAVAGEREQRRAWEDVAATLRTSLLPERLPRIPGVELSAVCQPADPTVVGGDFYDVFPASDGSWFVVMGDVCGKGPAAAAVTAAARHTIRTEAAHDTDPARILHQASDALYSQSEDHVSARWCTAALARMTPTDDGALLDISCGGHPLPRVLRADGTVEHAAEPGTVVGLVPDGERSTVTMRLASGDALVFFTDGIIEARKGDDLFGEEMLDVVLAHSAPHSSDDLVAAVLGELDRADVVQRDDAAVLVVRIP
jgi:sigma-B regulation protein RsbU (phosphoserine phosphatase)